ncbi:hypothetical protein HPB52_003175 [Rhipicephalus sanguineus]|uniref:Glycoside hydrolase 35 catalytic domain-containing protein n=1 Tax=Rhipicephalus sanguineus TaxID=34632 RepID=A0A9D4Q105_RHISA|nr:hypothetical protein HPB52_003175 [Rhipicephalus sanguineus]
MKQPSCETCGLSNAERWLPRVPNEVIVVLGGWRDERPQRSVEVLDPHAKRWFQYKDPDFTKRAYHGVVLLNRRLYIVGGRQTRRFLRSTKSFGLDEGYWDYHALMEEPRGYVAVAALRGNIYAMGGHNVLRSNDESPLTWQEAPSLNSSRSAFGVATLGNVIYVIGGFHVDNSGKSFVMNGHRVQIMSGAIHYFRVLPNLWEDRLKTMQASGLNTTEF